MVKLHTLRTLTPEEWKEYFKAKTYKPLNYSK